MKRIVLSLISLLALVAPHVLAAGLSCDGCRDAELGQSRPVGKPHGGPEEDVVCVYLNMPNQCDSVVVEVDTRKEKGIKVRDYGWGAAAVMAMGNRVPRDRTGVPACRGGERAMVCIPRTILESGVTEVRFIPGNKGTCGRLQPTHVNQLLDAGTVPPNDPVRLGWAAPGSQQAPAKAGE